MKVEHYNGAKEAIQLRQSLGGISGQVSIKGEISGLSGCLDGLWGVCEGLAGDVSRLCGDISGITGLVDAYLLGDVSGLRGDVTGVWGRADGLRGQVRELLDRGLLWPKGQTLTLEMFASRYKLSMEFFDSSGLPALIAFHAVEGPALHWLAVRADADGGFIVGAFTEICKRSPGQEIIKVAVPGDANWQICDDLEVLRTDRVYVLEHVKPLLSAFPN